MNNLEFCNMLKEAKKLSGKTNVDIIVATRKSQGALSDMLNGRADYALDRFLPYIDAIDFRLVLEKDGNDTVISKPEDATEWLNNELATEPQSTYKLGDALGVSRQTASRISSGGTIRISVFLKLAEVYGYTVRLNAK